MMINFIGFVIISYVIYTRILRIKIFSGYISNEYYTIFLFFITTFFFILLIFSLLKLNQKNKDLLLNKLLQYKVINNIFTNISIISESPKKFYNTFIFNKIKVSLIIEKPISYILIKALKKQKVIFYITFCSIPKVYMAIIFFFSAIIRHNLEYFYDHIFLLTVPLFYNIYVFMIKDLSENKLKYFTRHLKRKKVPPDKLLISFADVTPDFPDAIDVVAEKNNKKLLKEFIDNFTIYSRIYNFVTQLEESSKKYIIYENIIIYTLYFLGWFYIFCIFIFF